MAILLAELGVLLVLKATFNPYPVGSHSIDGALYYQVARHVAEGGALETSVSVYNAGLSPLPHPTNLYPLWPLVLGQVGRVVGLHTAAIWLPDILYFAGLILLYWLTSLVAAALRLDPVVIRWRHHELLDIGHLTVAILGLNRMYFRYTSLPYADGLGFALLFATLVVASYAVRRRLGVLALIAGALAGCAYLARSQMAGAIVAVPVAFAITGFRGLRLSALALIGSLIVVTPWLVFLGRSFEGVPLVALMDLTTLRTLPELRPYEWLIRPPSWWVYVLDRLHGVVVAFDPGGQTSYVRSFGYATFLVPIAVIVAIVLLVRRRKAGPSPGGADRESWFPVIVVCLTGILLLLPAHDHHANRDGGWAFQRRPGVPFILLIVAAGAFLSKVARPTRVLAAVLLLMGVVHTAGRTAAEIWLRTTDYGPPPPAQMAFAEWVDRQNPPPLFAAVGGAFVFGAISTGRYHEVECNAPRQQGLVYLDVLRVDYVVTTAEAEQCEVFRAVGDRIKLHRQFKSDHDQLRVWSIVR